MAPKELGHYRIDSPLGRGGMGEVFLAFDTRLGRPVAIKVMSSRSEQAAAVHRFMREARAASALNHPNIVTVHDVGESRDGEPFIVQEFIEGRTLRSLLRDTVSPEAIIDIGRQVARALSAAHAAGIVHRDVKPENVMVRADGYVKVLDFGVARIETPDAHEQETKTNLDTAPGVVLGTTPYLSPESLRSSISGPPSDVFALGVTLYEVAAGHRPFSGANDTMLLAAILSEQPVPLTRLNPAIPLALDELVQRMLAKEPERRPSAKEVDDALGVMQGRDEAPPSTPAAVERRTVGREPERAALRRAFARARDGHGLLVAATGEAGIGKSSLTEDFLSELNGVNGQRPIVGRGRCSERLAGADAYLPILEALDHLLRRAPGLSVDTVMRTVAPTWYLQVASQTEHPSMTELTRAAPATSAERLKRELAALLEDVSRTRPVVLFLDDVHWADVSTVDMLNYIAGRFSSMRVLVLVTYRPSDMARAENRFIDVAAELRSRGVYEEVALGFLDLSDVERYLALEFPEHRFPLGLAAFIHAKTEGSPLFMADLVRDLCDSGVIAQQDGRWTLTRPIEELPKDVPASVKGMIDRKIARIEERDRKMLLAAAVQGPEFDTATVAEAADMDPGDVEERLEILERTHVLVRRGREEEFRDRTLTLTYQFVHVLYQNALYASLQPTRRVTLSGRIAKALVRRHGERAGEIAGQLAILFEAARDFDTSARYYLEAAQRALALFAFRETRSLAERGLRAVEAMPEGPQRNQQELGLQMVLGQALRFMKGWSAPEIEPVFARASELCHQLQDPPELFPVLWAITLFHAIRGDLAEYKRRADQLMVMAEASGNPIFLMGAHHLVGVNREFLGDMVEASRILDRGRELHEPDKHLTYTAMYGLDPGMIARAMSSRPMFALGHPDRALERARETLALARSQRQPATLVFALLVTQGIHLNRGEADEAIALGEEVIELCQEYEMLQEREWSRSFQGAAFALKGRIDEGIEILTDSLEVQQSINSGLVRSAFLGVLGDLLRFAGRLDEGLTAVEEGFAHAGRTLEGGYVAELHRARGQLLQSKGNLAGAEEDLRQAIEHARTQQTKAFELRAATALAGLLASAGRTDEARGALQPVYDWFTEGHDTMDLRAARAVLDDLA